MVDVLLLSIQCRNYQVLYCYITDFNVCKIYPIHNGVHNVIHTMQSVPIRSDTSVVSNADYASITQAKQSLQECKPPPSCSKNLQPMLVNQTKSILDGNKNKTGCLDGASHSTKQDVNMSNQNTMVDMVNICSPANWSGDHSEPSNEGRPLPYLSDRHWKPHLDSQEKNLEGNKNKIGSLDGFNAQIRNANKEDIVINFSTTAVVSEQVHTVDSDTILDGNCDHNSSQLIECDGNFASKNLPKVLLNGVTNQIHTFGFCPLTPLHLYTGDPE